MRRKSARLIEETAHFHRTLIDILQGKLGDLHEITARLREADRNLGRREGDRGVAQDHCDSMENTAELLLQLGVIEQLPRRINLRKTRGEKLDVYPVGAQITGWEVKPPRKRERYFLYLDDGRVFWTSTVQQCGHDYLRTVYSHYALQVLEEAIVGKAKHKVGEREQLPEPKHQKEDESPKPVHDKPAQKTGGLAKTVYEKSRAKLRLAGLALFLALLVCTGYFIASHLKKQERASETRSQEADLRGADLRTADLQGMKLKGANLWRSDLSGVQLQKANLEAAYLCEANLQEANLLQSNLERVALPKANLQGAILRNANLEGADLPDANLKEADLRDANLKGAFMRGANLQGANLKRADLRESWGLTVEQLSKVKTLYRAKLRPELLEQVKEEYPHLFEMPSDEGEG